MENCRNGFDGFDGTVVAVINGFLAAQKKNYFFAKVQKNREKRSRIGFIRKKHRQLFCASKKQELDYAFGHSKQPSSRFGRPR